VGDPGQVHPYVIVIIEIQELLSGELSAVVGEDGVRDPKMENNALDKIYCVLGADLNQGPCLDPHRELVNCDKHVGQAPSPPVLS
jgi:hypothetical protein